MEHELMRLGLDFGRLEVLKKGSRPIMSNFFGLFFHFFGVKKIFFNFFENTAEYRLLLAIVCVGRSLVSNRNIAIENEGRKYICFCSRN